ncbi:MAG: GreA/GreB family elongation factor [Gammaproteobacteria bacterium]|nr:GreA/GreB family elongation factor [Gammaproteobacteria bacterium]
MTSRPFASMSASSSFGVRVSASAPPSNRATGAAHRFTIVGEVEAHASQNRISGVSSLAAALLNRTHGATVTWRRPAGDVDRHAVYVFPFRDALTGRHIYWRDVDTVDAYSQLNMEMIDNTQN